MTIGVKIKAIDYYTAQNTIANDDLTKILDTSDEWITTRTGIKQRKVTTNNITSTDLGIEAAKKIIDKNNINPDKIDLIIVACSAPEDIYPSVSCIIQNAIKAKNAACFDLRAACAGMIYSLNTASVFIKSGIYKNILIVATDTTTKFTDWNDRSTCVLFGDGAGALLLEASEVDNDILGINMFTDGSAADYITLKVSADACPLVENDREEKTKPFIYMKGKDVYKFVMTKIPDEFEKLLQKTNITADKIDYFIPHQSNQRMIDALAERLNIDSSRVISNIADYGNMSAASIPVAIKEGIEKGTIKLPALIGISAFGAGMTGANAIIKLDKCLE